MSDIATAVNIPAERWNYRRHNDPDERTPDRMYTERSLPSCDSWEFDPGSFGIPPAQATSKNL